jgi:hypothetical protein
VPLKEDSGNRRKVLASALTYPFLANILC